MDAAIEEDLKHVLNGEALTSANIIDVSDVGEYSGAKYVPITKQTVCYIVAGIFFNEKGEVLMMQEAKRSCYEKWYLPAGRLEPNETIEEGVIREVLEETGLMCKPTTLISVEVTSTVWYRFTMTGFITGGRLKTTSQRDKESLQANWFSVDTVKNIGIPIRSGDILKLIDVAVAYQLSQVKPVDLLPAMKSHQELLLRLVLVHINRERNETMLLIGRKYCNHLPLRLINPREFSLYLSFNALYKSVFGLELSVKILGVLSIEHSGQSKAGCDGVCLTVMAVLDGGAQPNIIAKDTFSWLSINNEDLKRKIDVHISAGGTVPLLL